MRSSLHPDRNAQFEYINATAADCLERGQPVISVDTKKKELVGGFKNAGREWQPEGTPEHALVHDFPQDSSGKAIPYGIYDMGHNEAWVNVGRDHDTPAFAVASIRRWWQGMGQPNYTQNWRGKPLRCFETIVDLIGHTRTTAGLRVKAKLDKRVYPVQITAAQMASLSLHRHTFQGDWNYELRPRKGDKTVNEKPCKLAR